nr:MAG TPA: hypothetical protein [Caudoviricetes sp.]
MCACTSVKVFTKPKDDSRERPAFIIFKKFRKEQNYDIKTSPKIV